jgi:hypothetical protein
MLTNNDKESILSEFPNVKLSYENIIHKNVYNADIILAIPEGIKCFAWFYTFNEKNVCFIMELTEKKQIKDIRITNACFSNELSYGSGTILYGTIFNHSYNRFFSIEDISFYKGKHIEREKWGNKLLIFKELLKTNLKQVSYNNSFIVFGLPLLSENVTDLISKIKNVNYKIDTIQFRSFNTINSYLFTSYKCFIESSNEPIPVIQKKEQNIARIEIPKEKIVIKNTTKREIIKNEQFPKKQIVFLVRPDIQNDIYHLFYDDLKLPNNHTYYDVALIPNFNTSVMMNKLFRKIKENDNLDALEESDDEEEFENEKDDRFVHLDKEYKMICLYNYKFKKWYPVKLADTTTKISTKNDLPTIEKK